ncbi:fasciclin-like arabinogalactan protein 1 isoform X3 [Sesamum indicum]|uniref:Fasciclin-like arabinogalactan protein 1 isoform X1 n=1 Tax=Sesamum indicum TaxID=4182 RepID=A0A8M8VC61_SESIN|nr:fasciclin-like arabinogalactan protein 1 isoform X1 [Sesamum indicum]XP_020553903.1 fasciclin-like arabinogalactan protein 1 isoform X2 [Sesamum indicum]XP_020553904.1 fasciclin-like arabinogalactan protein 1 isoform X3 [Sesamum indicum]
MLQLRLVAAAAAVLLSLSLLILPSTTYAHNITRILDKYPDFSTFNHYLTLTQLAPEINRRETITVCAVDNARMSDLLSKHLNIGAIKNVLSLHVLLDYFDSKKLHQITDGTALAATMFQATGSAPGSAGFVNITDLKGGKVGFAPQDNGGVVSATFVKPVEAIPYNISVIQISSILPSPEAEAPAPGPSQTNITALMSAHGCKVFAETLLANPAEQTFEDNVESGLTIFCPGDDAMKSFMPKYKNLTAAGKQSLLEYHGIPVYQSLAGLKSSNGLTNTLATDGASKFDFTVQNDGTDVTIITKIVTAKIMNTLVDEQPLAIYELNKVLMPKELFKAALSPTPAPAPAPEADAESPKPSKKKHKSPPAPAAPSDSPADAPDGDVADQTTDSNGAVRFEGGRFVGVILSLWFAFLQL